MSLLLGTWIDGIKNGYFHVTYFKNNSICNEKFSNGIRIEQEECHSERAR